MWDSPPRSEIAEKKLDGIKNMIRQAVNKAKVSQASLEEKKQTTCKMNTHTCSCKHDSQFVDIVPALTVTCCTYRVCARSVFLPWGIITDISGGLAFRCTSK